MSLDIIFVSILLFTAIVGFFRGFIKEFFSLAGWGAAFWSGLLFSAELEPYLQDYFSNPKMCALIAFSVIFAVVFFVCIVLSFVLNKFLGLIGFGPLDKFLGLIFGSAKGCIIVCAGVIILSLTNLADKEAQEESYIFPKAKIFSMSLLERFEVQELSILDKVKNYFNKSNNTKKVNNRLKQTS